MRATTGSGPACPPRGRANPSIAELAEPRQVDRRAGVLREDPAGGVRERHRLGLERATRCEDAGERVVDGEQLGHARTLHAGTLRRVISVVVPVHDEERSVELLYDELAGALGALGEPWEVVFVDDGSTRRDASPRSPGSTSPRQRPRRPAAPQLRQGGGARRGVREVEGDVVVTIDGDLQDDPAEIPRLLAKLDEGYDLVTGWKTHRSDPFLRRALSRVFNTVTGWLSGVRLHDMNCGLKAFRVDVARNLDLYGELHRFVPVLAHDLGFRVTEIGVKVDTGEPARHRVEDTRERPPQERVAAMGLPPRDEVEPLVELREQAWDLGGIVLQVAVDRHDDVPLHDREPRVECRRLSRAAPHPDDADVRRRLVQPDQRRMRPVPRSVVDVDDLP